MIVLALLVQAAGLDISNMPIEDAVTLMFMITSQDARDDTRNMLSEMEQTRQKRAAMREAQQLMAKEMMRLRALAKPRNGASPNSVVTSQVAWANQLPMICGKRTGIERENCLIEQMKKRTSELRHLPVPR